MDLSDAPMPQSANRHIAPGRSPDRPAHRCL